jgi:hypothetical protein
MARNMIVVDGCIGTTTQEADETNQEEDPRPRENERIKKGRDTTTNYYG